MALPNIVLSAIAAGAYDVLSPYAKGQWSTAKAIQELQTRFGQLNPLTDFDAQQILFEYDKQRRLARQLNEFNSTLIPPEILHGCMPNLESEFAYSVVTQYRLPGEDRDRSINSLVLFDRPANRQAILQAVPETAVDDSVQASLGLDVGLPEIMSQIIIGAFRRC
jgi:hypothetical protein